MKTSSNTIQGEGDMFYHKWGQIQENQRAFLNNLINSANDLRAKWSVPNSRAPLWSTPAPPYPQHHLNFILCESREIFLTQNALQGGMSQSKNDVQFERISMAEGLLSSIQPQP